MAVHEPVERRTAAQIEAYAAHLDFLRDTYERDLRAGREGATSIRATGGQPRRTSADEIFARLRGACRLAQCVGKPGHRADHR